jgi:hypothetical protein
LSMAFTWVVPVKTTCPPVHFYLHKLNSVSQSLSKNLHMPK